MRFIRATSSCRHCLNYGHTTLSRPISEANQCRACSTWMGDRCCKLFCLCLPARPCWPQQSAQFSQFNLEHSFVLLSFCLSVYLPACLPTCLSVCLCVLLDCLLDCFHAFAVCSFTPLIICLSIHILELLLKFSEWMWQCPGREWERLEKKTKLTWSQPASCWKARGWRACGSVQGLRFIRLTLSGSHC